MMHPTKIERPEFDVEVRTYMSNPAEQFTVTITKLRNAKSLPYEVKVGTMVYARVFSHIDAEEMADLLVAPSEIRNRDRMKQIKADLGLS